MLKHIDRDAMSSLPETRYALSGDISIAYQVMGDGPTDLILVPGIVSHVEAMHELPGYTDFLRRLARFFRVVTFDKRGQGLSDRVTGAAPLEQRMDDVRAIMDAIGSSRAALLGFSEGSAMSALFAATHPDRVSHLMLFGGYAVHVPSEPGPLAWGAGMLTNRIMPNMASSPQAIALVAKIERLCASPGTLKAFMEMNRQIDVRPILPTIQVPTLVLHRQTDIAQPIERGRDLAARIPGARLIEYPNGEHAFWTGDTLKLTGDIEEFVTGQRREHPEENERILATVLFTDIVRSTDRAVELGDQRWRQLLDEHDRIARQAIEKHRGRMIKSTGDGVLATFDGPGRAVRCALSFQASARQIGLPIRAGLHTGEIELRGSDVGGIAVHAAARVLSKCAAEEVLASRVVTDLVAGAGLNFAERGVHELRGLPGKWELYAASA